MINHEKSNITSIIVNKTTESIPFHSEVLSILVYQYCELLSWHICYRPWTSGRYLAEPDIAAYLTCSNAHNDIQHIFCWMLIQKHHGDFVRTVNFIVPNKLHVCGRHNYIYVSTNTPFVAPSTILARYAGTYEGLRARVV